MSQWRPDDAAAKSRGAAMVGDLIPDAAPSPIEGVPHWLVAEQKQHRQGRQGLDKDSLAAPSPALKRVGSLSALAALSHAAVAAVPGAPGASRPASVRKKPRGADGDDGGRNARVQKDTVDDELIMFDLFDGAHLPTGSGRSVDGSVMSAIADSALAKQQPQIESATPQRWQKLKAEAQEARRRSRGASIGSHAGHPPPLPGSSPSLAMPERILSPPEEKGARVVPSRAPSVTASPELDRTGNLQTQKERLPDAPPWGLLPLESPPRPDRLLDVATRVPGARTESRLAGPAMTLGASDDDQTFSLAGSSTKKPQRHGRTPSYQLVDIGLGDEVDAVQAEGSATGRSTRSSRSRRRKRRADPDHFHPNAWGWKRPAEEDAIMPSGAWIYLALIGWITFALAYTVNYTVLFLSGSCIAPLGAFFGSLYGLRAEIGMLAALRALSLVCSFLFVLNVAPKYVAGSGIPEMKCVLSGVFMPQALNGRTLIAKMVGLSLSLASGVSIGRLGPFIHISGITAALVSRQSCFKTLQSSARFQLQALSAAMAAGVGATFGAPIGGTMLAIELMSTYYYIHWLPMAMYCSIMGYYLVVALVDPGQHSYFYASLDLKLQQESIFRLATYIFLGMVCGVAGAALVKFTTLMYRVRTRFFTNSFPKRTIVYLVIFAAAHTVITTSMGGVMQQGQRAAVIYMFNNDSSPSTDRSWLHPAFNAFDNDGLNASFSLFVAAVVKFVLTGMSLVLPVPAGTFMPIFEVGALLGRSFGELFNCMKFVDFVEPRATAIVGAAALASGTLHTISIAVVMLELTSNGVNVLPLTIGVIVSYAVSKHLCSDLFSELIKLRRLPFILGLRERYPLENDMFYKYVASIAAGSFMSKDFPYVTPHTTRGQVYRMLTAAATGVPWRSCAFLSDDAGRRLWGTISRQSLWDFLGDEYPQPGTSETNDSGKGPGEYGTFQQNAARSATEHETIDFLSEFDPSVGDRLVDMGPMQVSFHAPFWKVITYFRMLGMSSMYVIKDGATVGLLTKAQVITAGFEVEAKAKRRHEQEKVLEQRRKRADQETAQLFKRNAKLPSARMASRLSQADLTREVPPLGPGRRSRQSSLSTVRR